MIARAHCVGGYRLPDDDLAALVDIDALSGRSLCEACARQGVPAVVQTSLPGGLSLVETGHFDDGRRAGIIDDDLWTFRQGVVAEVDIAAQRFQRNGLFDTMPVAVRQIQNLTAGEFHGTESTDEAVATGIGYGCRGLHRLHGHTREGNDLPEVVLRLVRVSHIHKERRAGGNGAAHRQFEVDVAVVALLDQAGNCRIAECVRELGRRHVEGQAEHVPVVDDDLTAAEAYVVRSALLGGGIDNGCQVPAVVERQYLCLRLRLSTEQAA